MASKPYFTVKSIEKKPGKRSPSAPFTTSTLQQEASRKLGFSVAQTMMVAQRLYESGKITYMRTDSVNLSETALNSLKEVIHKEFGAHYHFQRNYKTKSKSAQEAHEAIRPTYPEHHEIEGDANEKKLYDLIWKRSVASQMKDAEIEKTTLTLDTGEKNLFFIASGEVIVFDGFLKLYEESKDEEESESAESLSIKLPLCKEGDVADWSSLKCIQRFTHYPPRYTEAGLVKKLEELGIGRPSTYAPTISTILKRNYVEKASLNGTERLFTEWVLEKGEKIRKNTLKEITGADRNKLIPTDIGMMVNDFLVEYFPNILDYGFTAKVEDEFDEIANGKYDWVEMLRKFYKPFHQTVDKAMDESQRVSGERLLGTDLATGKPVIARLGRYGPIVQIGSTEDPEKRFASLRKDQRIETITLEEALDLFKLPRKVGDYEGKEVKVNVGRFGPYILHNNAFTSLGKEDDPFSVNLDRCIELIEAKRRKDQEKIIRVFEENPQWQILKGRWGPYVSDGNKNYKLPKTADPLKITLKDLLKEIGISESKNNATSEHTKSERGKKPSAKKAVKKTKSEPKKTKEKKSPSKSAKKAARA